MRQIPHLFQFALLQFRNIFSTILYLGLRFFSIYERSYVKCPPSALV